MSIRYIGPGPRLSEATVANGFVFQNRKMKENDRESALE